MHKISRKENDDKYLTNQELTYIEREYLESKRYQFVECLIDPGVIDNRVSNEESWATWLPNCEDLYLADAYVSALKLALEDDSLTIKQRKIITLSMQGLTQKQIGASLGVNQANICKSLIGNMDYTNDKKYGGIYKKLYCLIKYKYFAIAYKNLTGIDLSNKRMKQKASRYYAINMKRGDKGKKICSRCRLGKEDTEFYKSHGSICKACMSEIYKEKCMSKPKRCSFCKEYKPRTKFSAGNYCKECVEKIYVSNK